MRYAIISDIHGNLAAFKAVLDDIKEWGGVERIWCLGDIVGYGPDPGECIELLCKFDHICIAGNHDWGALGRINLEDFNPQAAAACSWTSQQLGYCEMDYLAALPLRLTEGDFTLVHGSPRDPVWEYLFSTYSAMINMDYFNTRYCLVGHSHVPVAFEHRAGDGECRIREISPEIPLMLENNRLIINPGSVGQPRDGDPRASYAVFDSEQNYIRHYRVPYDVSSTQRRMEEYGLPSSLIARLSQGW